MNKVLRIALFLLLFWAPISAVAQTTPLEGEVQIWTFEIDDDEDYVNEVEDVTKITPASFEPPIEEISLEGLTSDYKSKFKYTPNPKPNIKPARLYSQKDLEPISGGNIDAKAGDFSLKSTSKKSKNDYFENTLNQRTELKYSKKRFEVSTGYETKYDNPDASLNSKNVFLAPKINLNEEFSLIYNNKIDPAGTKYEQEVGLNFKPKILPHSTFGVTTGTTVRNGSGEKTQKMKFSTDLLLW